MITLAEGGEDAFSAKPNKADADRRLSLSTRSPAASWNLQTRLEERKLLSLTSIFPLPVSCADLVPALTQALLLHGDGGGGDPGSPSDSLRHLHHH